MAIQNIRPLLDYLRGKKILILGMGREGRSSLNFLEKFSAELGLKKLALADALQLPDELTARYPCFCGADYLEKIQDFDLVLKAPGVSLKCFTKDKARPGYLTEFPDSEISGQIDLFLRFVQALPTLAVSGTKGKSTTTALLYEMMKASGCSCYLRGNIGVPVFDGLEAMEDGAWVCLELSSHQLEFVQASPHLAALTNFYPEHLDHYRSYEAYLDAKLNLFRFQKADDLALVNFSETELRGLAMPLLHGRRAFFSEGEGELWVCGPAAGKLRLRGSKLSLETPVGKAFELDLQGINPQLMGHHHFVDAALAAGLAWFACQDEAAIRTGLERFEGLPHRTEWLRCLHGVDYYNDSIATIPQATLLALETLGNVSCLLVGGMDRGVPQDAFCAALLNCESLQLLCLPDTGYGIAEYFEKHGAAARVRRFDALEEAVCAAQKLAPPGTAVLLSPAASSYHRYKNFEERGNAFKAAVKALR